MNRFDGFLRWAASMLVVCTVAVALGGCEGKDGKDGANGTSGTAGADGQACWDLNNNGVGDVATEDINGDGAVDVLDCGAGVDPLAAAIDSAQIESCATCHGDVGEENHQALYDRYVDASALALTITGVSSVDNGNGTFAVTAQFTITDKGVPFVDPNLADSNLRSLDQIRFYSVEHFSATQEYLYACTMGTIAVVNLAAGEYSVTDSDCGYAPEASNAMVYGYIARGPLWEHEGVTDEGYGSHVHLYDDVSNAAMAFGTAAVADASAYESPANVEGCQKCHGTPYLKHGYRAAEVTGIPDFAACKSCHYDDRNGGHADWQYMVDEPYDWATNVAAPAGKYAYKAKLMNDVHMSHAMEFPYPQSMANCATCHEGKLDVILDNSNFQAETCKSCHPIQGTDAWPGEKYAQEHRAPPFAYLWQKDSDLSFHFALLDGDCTACHGNPNFDPPIPSFSDFHSGYDHRIYDEAGQRYADLFSASIDGVAVAGDVLTVSFSADASAITNAVAGTMNVYVYVSFYGWDTKQFIVASHTRDNSGACQRWSGTPPAVGSTDCRYEVSTLGFTSDPANADPTKTYNPLFPSLTETAPGSWDLEVDMAAWLGDQPGFSSIPALIADGTIRRAEVTLAPRLDVPAHDETVAAGLNAITQTFDPTTGASIPDWFKGAAAIVRVDGGCNDCHDQLAVTFHEGSGRGGDIVACRNCHVPTSGGSHLEMQSRSIESYVHAIHSFQEFDTDDVFNDGFDPVFTARYNLHINHTFPNFSIRNCEACHNEGKFNVPDQSQSMPGLLSASYDVLTWYDNDPVEVDGDPVDTSQEDPAGRNIHNVPEYVTGPASRACGGCHRADLINADYAGDLAAFNAHTEAFGTLVENDSDDEYLFGIIEKIMTWFE